MISMDDLLLNRTSEANRTDREMRVPANDRRNWNKTKIQ